MTDVGWMVDAKMIDCGSNIFLNKENSIGNHQYSKQLKSEQKL